MLATTKRKHTMKNGALQITFYQWLNNIHYEKHTVWVGRRFLFCLFVLLIVLVLVWGIFLFFLFFFFLSFFSFVWFNFLKHYVFHQNVHSWFSVNLKQKEKKCKKKQQKNPRTSSLEFTCSNLTLETAEQWAKLAQK